MKLNDFEGKTVKSVDRAGSTVLVIAFTDGSALTLSSQNRGYDDTEIFAQARVVTTIDIED